VRLLLAQTSNPLERLTILLLLKTGLGVQEIVNLEVNDVYLGPSSSNITSTISPKSQPYLYVEQNEKGPGSGHSKRLCDTRVPIDRELETGIKRYLKVRPDSPHTQLLLSMSRWGEPFSSDSINHAVEKNARKIGLHEKEGEMGRNLSPERLMQCFKYRVGCQPATKQYLTGRKKKMPYPWPVLVTDYREGMYELVSSM
jgi:site-specific recombinase XerC